MRFSDFTPFDIWLLLQGLGVSLGLFLSTSLIGLLIGTSWAICRFYRVPVLTPVITFIAELLKNSPVLVQLFLVFFGLPGLLHIRITPTTAATITLSANSAAFVYVIAVSAIESIGRDQIEAARVFGLTRWQVLRHVVIPLLYPTIRLSIFFAVVGSLQLFDLVMPLTRGGPADSSNTMVSFLYNHGISRMRVGFGSAIGVILFVICVTFAFTYKRWFMRNE